MNMVSKISYKNCDASYVGQTCKQLKTRISEHKDYISRNISTHFVITEQFNHDFDWEGVEILDVERNFNKRLISKMINIKYQENGINLQLTLKPWIVLIFLILISLNIYVYCT